MDLGEFMRVKGRDPVTGKPISVEASGITDSVLKFLSDFDVSDKKVKEVIDQLDVSADAKSALFAIAKVTIVVGGQIIKIGRKILDVIVRLANEFPNAGFGAILGGVLGFLVGSVPFIGLILGPICTPLLIAFGLAVGTMQDFRDKALVSKIISAQQNFSTVSG
jgi:hypothetical protein